MAGRRDHYGEKNNFRRGAITNRRIIKSISELRKLGDNVLKAAKAALKEGADIVVADAKSRVPVRTGALRDSIKAIPNGNKTIYTISADAHRTGKDGRKFYYGQAVEFDSRINKPFLYPAMDAHREEIYNKVDEAIYKAIEEA